MRNVPAGALAHALGGALGGEDGGAGVGAGDAAGVSLGADDCVTGDGDSSLLVRVPPHAVSVIAVKMQRV